MVWVLARRSVRVWEWVRGAASALVKVLALVLVRVLVPAPVQVWGLASVAAWVEA